MGVSPPPDPNRVVFNHMLAALVHGSGYERIATPGRSDRTIRRRLLDWAERDVGVELLKAALAAYDQMIGLDLDDLSSDGSITKRSVVTDARGIPLAPVGAGANRHDAPLYEPTMRQIPDTIGPLPDQPWVHPDRGYDSTPTRDLLDELGYVHEIAHKGIPAPIQAGKRWVVERTHSWMNGYGKIRRCTEKRRSTVEFYPHLAATPTAIRRLINEARTHYRWPARPTTHRLNQPSTAGRSKRNLRIRDEPPLSQDAYRFKGHRGARARPPRFSPGDVDSRGGRFR